MEQREAVIRLWFDMWLQQRDLGMESIFTPNCTYLESWGPKYVGIPAIRRWFHDWNAKSRVIAWNIRQFFHEDRQTLVAWYFASAYGSEAPCGFDGITEILWSPDGKIQALKEYGCKLPHHEPYAKVPALSPSKQLYIIGGTMGVGKTTVGRILRDRLPRCAFLDGDWCWDMHPFQINDQTKRMVLHNICYLLNSFLHCPSYENIVFCWVLHQQAILDQMLARLDTARCAVQSLSLVCREAVLRERLEQDVQAGLRTADVIERSVSRLPLYASLRTWKVDVSDLTPQQAADRILQISQKP